jgi:hypothetical protein
MSTDQPRFFTTVWHTQHPTLSVIAAHRICSQKHVRYKLPCPCAASATMPLLLDVELPSSLQKSGFVTAPSISTTASTATNGNSVNDDFLLLGRLQGIPIYAPPVLGPLALGQESLLRPRSQQTINPRRNSSRKQGRRKNTMPPLARLRGSPKSRKN